jgi:hypothetical protein
MLLEVADNISVSPAEWKQANLHRGELLETKSRGVYHEESLRQIDVLQIIKFERNNKQNEQDQETGSLSISASREWDLHTFHIPKRI